MERQRWVMGMGALAQMGPLWRERGVLRRAALRFSVSTSWVQQGGKWSPSGWRAGSWSFRGGGAEGQGPGAG